MRVVQTSVRVEQDMTIWLDGTILLFADSPAEAMFLDCCYNIAIRGPTLW